MLLCWPYQEGGKLRATTMIPGAWGSRRIPGAWGSRRQALRLWRQSLGWTDHACRARAPLCTENNLSHTSRNGGALNTQGSCRKERKEGRKERASADHQPKTYRARPVGVGWGGGGGWGKFLRMRRRKKQRGETDRERERQTEREGTGA